MFKIGDIVEPLESSNQQYLTTTKHNQFIGEVVSVDKTFLTLKTISCKNRGEIGIRYRVECKYFELVKSNRTTINKLRGAKYENKRKN